MQKKPSHDPTTTFVTKDIAQGWGIGNDTLTIIKARISARS